MEIIWYILASLGAGISTGLAGLSAATIMVPILIVLCPSFAGESGAYHATAIALASDILGSLFTASIYIRHKNIDLRRGWLMMICIISMCVIGSFAAFYTGNHVLGGFSLILCVGIGLRFLIKPDNEPKQTAGFTKLDMKGILISLFFGLTIGFGTGFVGSGGGMMMLVVFTAFLGMDRKSAVGTSTLIMTFTALIAFTSHAMIDPTLLSQHSEALCICIICATVGSIVSAQFANKVNNKTVSIVTGTILTILGISLLLFNNWSIITNSLLIRQIWQCMIDYLIFICIIILLILTLRICFKMPKELSRKLFQFPALASVIFMLYAAETWQVAILCALIFCLAVYPILCLLEKWQGYSDLFVERRPGEVKRSLFLLFGTHIVIIAICCIIEKPYIAVTAIIGWGVADTAAALIGKRYGKHHITLPYADQKKTWEGSFAMALTTFISAAITLCIISPLPWYICLLHALIVAPFSAYTELVTHHGNDTVSVPVVITAVLMILSII